MTVTIPKERVTPARIEELGKNEIFVFGSNLRGAHLGGAVATARRKWGAVMGQGVGMQGKTYAIPTMFASVGQIAPYVDQFISYAKQYPDTVFLVTEIGCGIAGFSPVDIAPLFKNAMEEQNIHLPLSFWQVLTEKQGDE